MKLFDFTGTDFVEGDVFPENWQREKEFFILCSVSEIGNLKDALQLDETTIKECKNLDERVRYGCFQDYDFVSMVYPVQFNNCIDHAEISLYIAKRYLVLVMPDTREDSLDNFAGAVLTAVREYGTKHDRLIRIYYGVFNKLLTDYSDFLEKMEDELQALQSEILTCAQKKQFERIDHFGQCVYMVKKQLRALSLLGAQILVDENDLIPSTHSRYFRSVDTRFKKLSGFAEGLYDHVNQLICSYDSRLSMRTNEIVSKLTVFTLLFGPLTVITGIFGMNFDYMPGLHAPLGYVPVLVAMVLLTIWIYALIKHKKWL